MIKRMMLLASMALAAAAFTAPAAQADVFLSDANGTLTNGAEFTATSSNLLTTRPGGTFLSCTTVGLHLVLIDDGTEHLEIEQVGPVTTSGCELNRSQLEPPLSNLAITIDDGTLGVGEGNILTIDTWGRGETTASFRSTIFGGPSTHTSHTGILAADCTFSGPTEVSAAGATSDVLNVTGALTGLCGNGHLEGSFTLKTHDGTPISIHYADTA